MMPRKSRLMNTVALMEDAGTSGIIAASMHYLAHAEPTATSMTIIEPNGNTRYVSRAEAERFVFGVGLLEAKQ